MSAPSAGPLELLAAAAGYTLAKPTLEVIARRAAIWTDEQLTNVETVLRSAFRKLGAKSSQAGTVPPRVAVEVLDEAANCHDELMAEYLGGVLASSYTSELRDDRAIVMVGFVRRMSTYQLRTHYLFYALARRLLLDKVNLQQSSERIRHSIFIPADEYALAMEIDPRQVGVIGQHAMTGLQREELINLWGVKHEGGLAEYGFDTDLPGGLVTNVTTSGVLLFLAAHGEVDLHVSALTDSACELHLETGIELPSNARILPTPPGILQDAL